jgi:Ca-activated chloride channel family protein
VSGSMDRGDRLELVKEALALLVGELREDDRVGIVVYSDNSRSVLEPTSASNTEAIMDAINALRPEGSTNVAAGLQIGYQMAQKNHRDEGITRVIVLSDGVANVGTVDSGGILKLIKDGVESGITLSTIGFGMGNYNDVLMEQLANDGNGNYYYVDNLREARRVFVYNLTGTLKVIGYDAKVQVDFNPAVTDRYRLIGYENRAIADTAFRDDTVDAGEVGAGHSITALYEFALENADVNGVIATVYIRYRDAETREVVELNKAITTSDVMPSVDAAPADFRLHAAAAEFAELLRDSYWAQDGSYMAVLELAAPLADEMPGNAEVAELVELIRLAGRYVDR